MQGGGVGTGGGGGGGGGEELGEGGRGRGDPHLRDWEDRRGVDRGRDLQ